MWWNAEVWSIKYDVWCMKNVECRMKLKYGYEVCRMKLEVSNNACSKILEDSPFNIDHAAIGVIPILCWTDQGTWGVYQSRCCDFQFDI